MKQVLMAALVAASFNQGTPDAPTVFVCKGTLPDGTAYSQSFSTASPGDNSVPVDLPVMTGFTAQATKTVNGVTYSNEASDPVDITAPTQITLMVPDLTQKTTVLAG